MRLPPSEYFDAHELATIFKVIETKSPFMRGIFSAKSG
jgi:hypothetical protein